MHVKVVIDRAILSEGSGTVELSCNAGTVKELLEQLESKYAGLQQRCIDKQARMKQGLHVSVNGIEIDYLRKTSTVLKDGDWIAITKQELFSRKIYLTFSREIADQPIIWMLGNRYNLVINIRGAKVSKTSGIAALELIGQRSEIQKAVEWLTKKGAKVEPLKSDAKPQIIQ